MIRGEGDERMRMLMPMPMLMPMHMLMHTARMLLRCMNYHDAPQLGWVRQLAT